MFEDIGATTWLLLGVICALLLNLSTPRPPASGLSSTTQQPNANIRPQDVPPELLERLRRDVRPLPTNSMTEQDLSRYDGSVDEEGNLKPIYVAVAGLIFDVSSGRQFYGPGGPYECFAGRDATDGLAKGRLQGYGEADDGSKAFAEGKRYATSFNDHEVKILQRWQERFTEKYQIVALLGSPEL